MARIKIKLEEEAFNENLIADTASELVTEASNLKSGLRKKKRRGGGGGRQ
jgi:hypothetical protein